MIRTFNNPTGYRFLTRPDIRRESMKVYYLMDYLPVRYEGTPEQINARRAIFNFKDGCCPSLVINGLSRGIKQLKDNNTVVCFVPASSHDKTIIRYRAVASCLANLTGVSCSYTAISKTTDSESGHLAGKSSNPASDFEFDSSFFRGKKVILIDDVMTRGRTLNDTARRLKEAGAASVVGLVVGLTINPDWNGGENRNVERVA